MIEAPHLPPFEPPRLKRQTASFHANSTFDWVQTEPLPCDLFYEQYKADQTSYFWLLSPTRVVLYFLSPPMGTPPVDEEPSPVPMKLVCPFFPFYPGLAFGPAPIFVTLIRPAPFQSSGASRNDPSSRPTEFPRSLKLNALSVCIREGNLSRYQRPPVDWTLQRFFFPLRFLGLPFVSDSERPLDLFRAP